MNINFIIILANTLTCWSN